MLINHVGLSNNQGMTFHTSSQEVTSRDEAQAASGVESNVEKSPGVEAEAASGVESSEEKSLGVEAQAGSSINEPMSGPERASGAADNGIAEPMSGQARASGAEAQPDTKINKSLSGQEEIEKHVLGVVQLVFVVGSSLGISCLLFILRSCSYISASGSNSCADLPSTLALPFLPTSRLSGFRAPLRARRDIFDSGRAQCRPRSVHLAHVAHGRCAIEPRPLRDSAAPPPSRRR